MFRFKKAEALQAHVGRLTFAHAVSAEKVTAEAAVAALLL